MYFFYDTKNEKKIKNSVFSCYVDWASVVPQGYLSAGKGK